MRLIDAPIGIFRFDSELVLKTEYYSENKQSGKYIPDCYIVRTGEYFWGGAKTANELINLDVEPVDFAGLLPTITDVISRQAAIEALDKRFDSIPMEQTTEILLLRKDLRELPSAQPKRGKWIKKHRHYGGFRSYTGFDAMGEQHTITVDERTEYDDLYCSECGTRSADNFLNFCPKCGSYNGGDGWMTN